MIYHTQEHVHVPDTYPAGSCYPTVYACILDLPLNQVPYFNLLYFSTNQEKYNLKKAPKRYLDKVDYLWDEIRSLWLYGMGYTEDYIADHDKWLKENPERYYIASGISPRNVGHVVIYQNGKMIHDPHPSRAGLTKIESFSYLRKIEGDYEFDRYYLKLPTNGNSN